MCGHRHHHRGLGRRGRRFPNREEWIRRLEERQRDLEQEIADLAAARVIGKGPDGYREALEFLAEQT